VFFASFGVVMIHLFTFFLLTLLANVCLNFRKKVVVITTSLLDTIRAFLLALIPSLAFAFDYFAKWYLLAGFFLLCTFIIPFKKNIKLNFIRILFLLCGLFSLNAGIELQRCETSTSNVCVIQNALNKMTQDGSQYSSSNSSSSSSSWSSSSSDWSSSSSSSFGGGGGSSGGGGWGD
ncbi:hypothetical protein KGV55_03845, partial [Candidatus Gracilibacteria bacterium]|nr:hypothetical protein [Candidatus Gracilibacteria bacterium]